MKKEYTNGEVTVTWEPDVCIHSKLCWQGLLQVFNPQNRPWVNMDGASTQKIVDQVKKCPSGALGFHMNVAKASQEPVVEDESRQGDSISINITKDGPILIKGDLVIQNADGTTETRAGNTAFCRCGHSVNKPFCDGSHKKIGFQG